MKIVTVPVLEDNYAYLLVDETQKIAAAIDPVEPEKVLKAAEEHGAKITHVLTTHHHDDHSGGNTEMVEKISGLEVYGGDDRIPALTKKLGHDEKFDIGHYEVTSILTPCHTSHHLCFFVKDKNDASAAPALFSGDTLFVGGCGRFFEGTGEQMHEALNVKLGSLPDNTKVYCGHEYTVSNLVFAQHMEPENEAVKNKLEWAKAQREKGETTIPSTIAEEKSFNPFMRLDSPAVISKCGLTAESSPAEIMTQVRELKNNFKG